MSAHVVIGLALIALVLGWAIWSAVLDTLDERRRKSSLARWQAAGEARVRDFDSERARRYHESDAVGR